MSTELLKAEFPLSPRQAKHLDKMMRWASGPHADRFAIFGQVVLLPTRTKTYGKAKLSCVYCNETEHKIIQSALRKVNKLRGKSEAR